MDGPTLLCSWDYQSEAVSKGLNTGREGEGTYMTAAGNINALSF